MSLQANQIDSLLDTSTAQAAEKWHQLLNLQTDMFLPFEIFFFFNSDSWKNAGSVLDIGCGNGSYISQVSNHFPDKDYTAIDISSELISIAQKKFSASNILFQHKSLEMLEANQKYDIILMRLIVQHLKDFQAVLEKASHLLKPGGTLIIIEPDLIKFKNLPSTPKFEHLIMDIEEHSIKNKTNRHNLSEIGEMAIATNEWNVSQDFKTVIPFIGPFSNSKIMDLYQLWIDILEQSRILPITFGKIRDELEEWSREPTAYAQIGIRILNLEMKR